MVSKMKIKDHTCVHACSKDLEIMKDLGIWSEVRDQITPDPYSMPRPNHSEHPGGCREESSEEYRMVRRRKIKVKTCWLKDLEMQMQLR